MKAFVAYAAALLGAVSASPITPLKTIQQSGPLVGPVHAAFGDLVSTKRGLVPLSLEGFSEDDNQDGFVDNVGQAVVPVVAPAVYHHAPVYAHAPVVAHAPVLAHHAAPVAYATAPVVHKVVEPAKVEVISAPAVTYTQHVAAAPALAYAHHLPAVPAFAPAFAHQVNPYFAAPQFHHTAVIATAPVVAAEETKVVTE